MSYEKECEHAGIEYKIVVKFEKRITKLLKDMKSHGLSLFCGSACTIRYNDGHPQDLIVGDFLGLNTDGG